MLQYGPARWLEYAFGSPSDARYRRAQGAFLAVIFLGGIVAWLRFFICDPPEAFFKALDWGIERQYYSVIQEAYRTCRIPFHVSEPIQPLQPTQRFLAIPESLYVLSPQAPLLAFLTLKRFVIVNVLLHYAVGFWGCLLLRRRFNLSPVVFLILFLLFNFNGHIVAHVAAGHKWNGYFYLPLFTVFVLDAWSRSAPVFETAVKIALVNVFILMQGTLHPYMICLMFLALLVVFSNRARRTALLAVALTIPLSMFRLLPAALSLHPLKSTDFVEGYRSLDAFLGTIISIHTYRRTAYPWEYDLYVSALGLALLLFFGVLLRFSRRPELEGIQFRGLYPPLLILVLLSFHGYWHGLIVHLPEAIPNTERVPSRFMAVPLVFLIVVACARIQKLQGLLTERRWLGAGVIVGAVALARLLWRHWSCWRINSIEHGFRSLGHDLMVPHIITLSEPGYLRIVWSSFVFSLSTLLVVLGVWSWRAVRRRRDEPSVR